MSELYQDPTVIKLIDYLYKKGEITPSFSLVSGFRYPKVEQLTGLISSEANNFLEELSDKGILEKKFIGRIIKCPYCNSHTFLTKISCPSCMREDIERISIVEHVKCGYVAKQTQLSNMICPQCGRKIGNDYRKLGYWFECNSCKKRFDEPLLLYVCHNCMKSFSLEVAEMTNVYSYALSKRTIEHVQRGIIYFREFQAKVEQLGAKVKIAQSIRGCSHIEHRFDFIIEDKDGKTIAVDIAYSNEGSVGEASVIASFVKKHDTQVAKLVILAIPELSERGKNLAKAYGIEVIEAEDVREALMKLADSICAK